MKQKMQKNSQRYLQIQGADMTRYWTLIRSHGYYLPIAWRHNSLFQELTRGHIVTCHRICASRTSFIPTMLWKNLTFDYWKLSSLHKVLSHEGFAYHTCMTTKVQRHYKFAFQVWCACSARRFFINNLGSWSIIIPVTKSHYCISRRSPKN